MHERAIHQKFIGSHSSLIVQDTDVLQDTGVFSAHNPSHDSTSDTTRQKYPSRRSHRSRSHRRSKNIYRDDTNYRHDIKENSTPRTFKDNTHKTSQALHDTLHHSENSEHISGGTLTQKALFDMIHTVNTTHDTRSTTIQQWFDEKVTKFTQRGYAPDHAKKLASWQVKRICQRLFRGKMATPGTVLPGNAAGKTPPHGKTPDLYKNIGDSDGEGALYLWKRYIFGRNGTYTNYLSHDDIVEKAQTSSPAKNDPRIFLDGGGVPGVTVTPGKAVGLKSALTDTRIVIDHHPTGAASTTGMVSQLLTISHLIPPHEKHAVRTFARTIDIVDSFLSKIGKVGNPRETYAKSLCSLSYQLDSEELFNVCLALPKNIDPLSPLSDDFLQKTRVIPKGQKHPVPLIECITKKQTSLQTAARMIDSKIEREEVVTIHGKKFIVFAPNDNIANDARAVLAGQQHMGTIKIHANGGMFIVHDEGIPACLHGCGKHIRDVILVVNPGHSDYDFIGSRTKIIDAMGDGNGKNYCEKVLADVASGGSTGSKNTDIQQEGDVKTTDSVDTKKLPQKPSEEKSSDTGKKDAKETSTIGKRNMPNITPILSDSSDEIDETQETTHLDDHNKDKAGESHDGVGGHETGATSTESAKSPSQNDLTTSENPLVIMSTNGGAAIKKDTEKQSTQTLPRRKKTSQKIKNRWTGLWKKNGEDKTLKEEENTSTTDENTNTDHKESSEKTTTKKEEENNKKPTNTPPSPQPKSSSQGTGGGFRRGLRDIWEYFTDGPAK